jgi:hypothetical protein
MADTKEVVAPKVKLKAILRNSVAVIAATLAPRAVVVIPRTGARLYESAAHLPLVLWDTARVYAATGGFRGPDATVIGAARTLLRSLCRSISRSISWRLMLLLRGARLLMLLPLLRFALLPALLFPVLCVDRGSDTNK